MGRPTDLTEKVQSIIVESLKGGNTWRCAAQSAGVGWETVKGWKRRGKTGEEPYATFSALTQAAESYAESRSVRAVVGSGEPIEVHDEDGRPYKVIPDWKAHAWWLERRRWQSWWLAKPGKGVQKQPGSMSDGELASALLLELMKHVAANPKLGVETMQKLKEIGVSPAPESDDDE